MNTLLGGESTRDRVAGLADDQIRAVQKLVMAGEGEGLKGGLQVLRRNVQLIGNAAGLDFPAGKCCTEEKKQRCAGQICTAVRDHRLSCMFQVVLPRMLFLCFGESNLCAEPPPD